MAVLLGDQRAIHGMHLGIRVLIQQCENDLGTYAGRG